MFAKGTAPDCRKVVQQLNQIRGKADETQSSRVLSEERSEDLEPEENLGFSARLEKAAINSGPKLIPPEKSKWSIFLQDTEESGNHLD